MLRITIVDSTDHQKLVLEGRLMEPNVSELESAWETACAARGGRRCIVDLRNATFVDQSGERVLLRMKQDGAQFVACGVSTTYQLEQIGIRCRGQRKDDQAK